jgi:hypothetical protein
MINYSYFINHKRIKPFLFKVTLYINLALLLSTKINIHVNKHTYSSILIITKHNIWFKDEKKKKNIFALPTKSLIALIKTD